MAARKGKNASGESPSSDESIELIYTLEELPSSQHRAGLAGLVLLVQWAQRHAGLSNDEAKILGLSAHSVRLRFTARGLQTVFDTAYASTMREIEVEKAYKNKAPKRAETRTELDRRGKTKQTTVYVYDKAFPDGAFLQKADPLGDEGPWIKLWRDMVWSIPRGVPATRRPFEARAEGKAVNDGLENFKALARNPEQSVELPSTYFVGAQSNTADNVKFTDSARRQLLLHFWPFVVEVFVPRLVTREGKREYDGYAYVFPDINDLETYCDAFPDYLKGRSGEKQGYLPRACVVDLPGEAGLRTLSWLGERVRPKAQRTRSGLGEVYDLVTAVDVIHVRKDGNNIRVLSQERIQPSHAADYQRLSSAYWSHVFRRQRLKNLLGGQSWFDAFDRLFVTLPGELTLQDRYFQHDARAALTEVEMEDNRVLAERAYDIVGTYVREKLRTKYELKWADVKANKEKQKDYDDAKERVCKEAFLALRSRSDNDDIVEYVSGTLFAHTQWLPNKEAFVAFAEPLLRDPKTIRTLLLLALSAHMPRRTQDDAKTEEN